MTIMPWRGPGPNPEQPWASYPGFDPSAMGYPTIEIPDSYNPQYGQQTEPVPIPGDPGMSQSQSPTAPVTQHKKRGLLGSIAHALGSVFMPKPDSLWAAALRGGIYDARANRDLYRRQTAADDIALQTANEKLKNLKTKGEYQIAGNNVVHITPDGNVELITPPATPTEKERLIDRWRSMDDSDPAKELIRRMLLGSGSDEVLQSRERVAGTSASARIKSAGISAAARRAGGSGGQRGVKLPAGAVIIK